jgi:hypothetical protein
VGDGGGGAGRVEFGPPPAAGKSGREERRGWEGGRATPPHRHQHWRQPMQRQLPPHSVKLAWDAHAPKPVGADAGRKGGGAAAPTPHTHNPWAPKRPRNTTDLHTHAPTPRPAPGTAPCQPLPPPKLLLKAEWVGGGADHHVGQPHGAPVGRATHLRAQARLGSWDWGRPAPPCPDPAPPAKQFAKCLPPHPLHLLLRPAPVPRRRRRSLPPPLHRGRVPACPRRPPLWAAARGRPLPPPRATTQLRVRLQQTTTRKWRTLTPTGTGTGGQT